MPKNLDDNLLSLALTSLEFGYQCCERGQSIEYARQQLCEKVTSRAVLVFDGETHNLEKGGGE